MRRFPGAQLTALDAIGRPPFLVVTATRRKAQSVSREIQRLHPSGHVFAPRVEVFTDLSVSYTHLTLPTICSV